MFRYPYFGLIAVVICATSESSYSSPKFEELWDLAYTYRETIEGLESPELYERKLETFANELDKQDFQSIHEGFMNMMADPLQERKFNLAVVQVIGMTLAQGVYNNYREESEFLSLLRDRCEEFNLKQKEILEDDEVDEGYKASIIATYEHKLSSFSSFLIDSYYQDE